MPDNNMNMILNMAHAIISEDGALHKALEHENSQAVFQEIQIASSVLRDTVSTYDIIF